MVGIVKSLDVALAGNNLEKMAETMDKFESQFETLDVQTVRLRVPGPCAAGSRTVLCDTEAKERMFACCPPVLPTRRYNTRWSSAMMQLRVLRVLQGVVEQAMHNQAALSTPEEDVNDLMQQVAGAAPAAPSCWLLRSPLAHL